ncbi:serine/threonine-protein phosphatase 2A catalytic subunit B [Fonticula alba]|uniref:Serine/threonine-protein phosphatase n=1 Tax=Fonticula alba TaxID=691883 RepID=A0A058Z1F4_FONAL|nr:serine/threonine-protein phosphatase 2A catalytic subunit B [Fonticula alba]KCV68080.1 serine/threonine-protein phosphatase 2A catalytic subunit B [Fonticula alba]|eukprot:XP_009497454.1 serine/threonine-protein phosphatase 2A catalytic subunit B [Fonticula alba]
MKVDLDECIERITRLELLDISLINFLCESMKELLLREPNVVHISAPVTVVGDVHGQFYDVLEIFKVGGKCPDTNYLFLGDFVDRGHHSVETITLLMCLKLRYPDRITLIRGNHESRSITQMYGFYTECLAKYGTAQVWTYFTDMFDFLSIAALIDDRIFCVHGGIGPTVQTVDAIRAIDRFKDIPTDGPLADIMWSDPDPVKEDFSVSQRGAGFTFGKRVVNRFCDVNAVDHILRAHQLCMEGYQILFDDRLTTVWSAPNYCYRCGNKASILEVGENLERNFNIFTEAPESKLEAPAIPKVVDYFL